MHFRRLSWAVVHRSVRTVVAAVEFLQHFLVRHRLHPAKSSLLQLRYITVRSVRENDRVQETNDDESNEDG